jgi:hypothetical protein
MTMRRVGLISAVALLLMLSTAVVLRRHGSGSPRPTADPVPSAVVSDPIAVATEFLAALTPRALLDRDRRRTILTRFADPATHASLAHEYAVEAKRVRTAFGGPPLISRSGLLGYRLTRRDAAHVSVAIWAVGLAAGRAGTGASGWSTVTLTLRRHGGSWLIASVATSPGPDPTLPARALARAAASFQPFSHAR